MPNKDIPIKERILADFHSIFVEYSSEGRMQIAQNKPWYNGHSESWEDENEVDQIKSFLSSSIDRVLEEVENNQREAIGMLRQWLNEDRITDPKKMVTNEELTKFLSIIAELKK